MRSLMFAAVLVMPGIALGQSKPVPVVVDFTMDDEKPAAVKSSDTDHKLAQIEERLQAMIREIHALRAGNPAPRATMTLHSKVADEAKRAVARAVEPPKHVEKSEFKGMTWQLVPQGAGEKGEGKTVILRLANPDEKGGPIKIVGTMDMGVDVKGEQAKHAEKAAKQVHEGVIELQQGNVIILGENGKPMTQRFEVRPDGPIHSSPSAGQKHEEKVIIARLVEGKDGKFIVDATEEKPGEKRVFFFEDKKSGVADKVVKNVQNYAIGTAEKATSGESGSVNLTRAAYAMPQSQARALDSFLRENAKVSVLETKVEGDKLVVTTTPEVQHTIAQVVGLISGKSANTKYQLRFSEAPKPQFHYEIKPQAKPNPPYSEKDD